MRILRRAQIIFSAVLFSTALSSGLFSVSSPSGLGAGVAYAAAQTSASAVEAARLALAGKFEQAGPLAARSGDPAAIRLVEMLYLRDHWKEAGYNRIVNFLDNSPKWPLTETLLRRAELALYSHKDPAPIVLAFFANRKPVTAEGKLALARAYLSKGEQQRAREQTLNAWLDADISPAMEAQMTSEFGTLLTDDDYARRLWRLVYAQKGASAVRLAKKLGPTYQTAAGVAQKLLNGTAGAVQAYNKLSPQVRDQLGMKYALAYYYRKKSEFDNARAVLVSIPGSAKAMGDAEAWWTERRIVARRSVGATQNAGKAAYIIARNHGFSEGSIAVEGEFVAGWIALRYLKEPQTAMAHFQRLAAIAPTRTEKARAAYWIGRSFAAMSDKGNARKSYEEAAQYSTLYYGQLAREQIGLGKVPEQINSGQASASATAKVNNDEVIQALKLVGAAHGSTAIKSVFMWSLANRFNTVDDMNAAAAVAYDVGGPTLAVRLGKAASQRNLDIDSWAYPTKALPNWQQIGKPVERALVFGLSRQESEFDPDAGSSVGARGLMQIMPGTGQMIAKQYGLPYSDKMLKEPTYNVKLGAAHLADLVEDFNGSYVLTLVAYNAGPRRSREWVAYYGDLRSGQVDAVDWVESIPFQETRQYVQKVLQNTHVYRSRLAPKTVVPMSADLKRGTPASGPVATSSISE